MSTYTIVTGIAVRCQLTDLAPEGVRVYRDQCGGTWMGTETVDAHYYCDAWCAGDALRDVMGVDIAHVAPGGDYVFPSGTTPDAVTVDWHPVWGDLPDYDVHCPSCGDAVTSS